MLVLSRHKDESIVLLFDQVTPEELDRLLNGEPIEITTVDIRGDKVRLGVTAPRSVGVHRLEVHEAIRRDETIVAFQEALAGGKAE